jgi:FMN phosphatase YigB (HAD superfamily)
MTARRAVFFDIGDTLVRRPEIGPGRRIAAALGLGDDAARAITRLVFREPFASAAALVDRLACELDLASCTGDARTAITSIWQAQEREPIEAAGATACVTAVRATGAHVGVISNIWMPYAAGFRRACPAIVPRIDSWHLSYEQGLVKPDPALFEAALAAAQVPARNAVMVGDSLDKDVVPARALGMRAIWVVTDAPGRERQAERRDERVPPGVAVAHELREVERILLAELRW